MLVISQRILENIWSSMNHMIWNFLYFGNSSAIEYNNLLVLTLVALPQSFYAFDAIRSFLVIIARSFII